MAKTKIEWCDQTINPVIGCSKCSPGCENCYAEKFAARLARNGKLGLRALDYQVAVENGEWSGKVVFDLKCFDKLPKRPATVFLASMGDVFHENVPFHHIAALWRKMAEYPQHRFLVLTKRAERMEELLGYLRQKWARTISENPRLELANVWLGVTVCNQAEADEKVAHLLATPAAGRFISVEPMLGPIDLWSPKFKTYGNPGLTGAITGWVGSGLDWVICGGETGGQARPVHSDWVRGLRDQCRAAVTPFFFKGWGEWREWRPEDGDNRHVLSPAGQYWSSADYAAAIIVDESERNRLTRVAKVGKNKSGRLLDGVEHNDFPW